MNRDQKLLKAKLKIKQIKNKLNRATEENFGYCPNELWTDKLIEEFWELHEFISIRDIWWLKDFERKYCD